jgi:hypothetical protein
MTARHRFDAELSALFSIEKWKTLAKNVRDYLPDVVVLVARKTPRLAEVLQLDFGNAVVISDLAIPFCSSIFEDRRVAIVDDVINVGSTMDNARRQIDACGANSCRLFALAAKAHASSIKLPEVCLVDEDPMGDTEYDAFVRQVPSALQLVSKPYDLDYPLCNCTIRPPFSTPRDVCAWFMDTFGKRLHVQTTELEEKSNLARYSVDFPAAHGVNLKARFYFDFTARECNVVPMAIPGLLSRNISYSETTWAGAVWQVLSTSASTAPRGVSLWDGEPMARAELFVHSLAFSSTVLSAVNPVVALKTSTPFSLADTSVAFGPNVEEKIRSRSVGASLTSCELAERLRTSSSNGLDENPLWSQLDKAERKEIEDEAARNLKQGDLALAFHSLFEALARIVEATDARKYALQRPFSPEMVRENPYLRLRVGFSFSDIVSFFESRLSSLLDSMTPTKALVSELLDHYIDSGALVPAIANYGGQLYRVYRKGENQFWDEETNRALYAWQCLGEPLSLTRFAKLQAILSFSSEVATTLVPSAFERGNVGILPPSVVDRSGPEFGHFLLRSGKLKAARNEPQ